MKKYFLFVVTFIFAIILVGCAKQPTLEFAKTSYQIEVGEEKTLEPIVNDLKGEAAYTYEVSPEGILKVEEGKMKGLKEGEATVKVSLKDYPKVPAVSLSVKVVKVAVKSVMIQGDASEVRKGATISLTTVVFPKNATVKDATWKSSNPDILTVSESGVVTGISVGEAEITATVDGTESNKYVVTVLKPAVTDIEIMGESEMYVSRSQNLIAKVSPDDADAKVEWKSSDDTIATVSMAGQVTALKTGEVIITAKGDGFAKDFPIRIVKIEATDLEINAKTEMEVAEQQQILVTMIPSDAQSIVTYESSDDAVGTVTSEGMFTAVAPGNVTITVKADSVVKTITIKISGLTYAKVGPEETFTTIKDAMAAVMPGGNIYVAAGEYPEDFTIARAVNIYGPNRNINPNTGKRAAEAIITGKITLKGVSNVTLDGLAFKGNGQIVSTPSEPSHNLLFANLNVFEKGEPFKEWSEGRDNDLHEFIALKHDTDFASDIQILKSRFAMQDGAIKLHRVENVLIAGCEFLDFARDAIRFDGGVNGGEIIIGDNKFINETPGGVNGIYFRAYAREANSEESYITIFNNVFKNIGCGTDTEAYTGAISARNYQEGGVDIEIADNVFENCYNAMFIRNNAEVANHAAYPWKLTAEYNVFKGIPEGVYFRHKKGADKDETNPTLAKFQNNLFLDNDGNVITEPASEKLQGVKEIEDNLAKASDHEKGYFIGMEQPQAIVNNAWANIPAGTEIDFAGEVLKKGETAFGNIPEALAEVDGGYIYIMPGTYPESFAINKDNTVLVGLGGCPKALGEDDYYNVAVFLPDVTVTINANVKHTVLGLLGFSGSAMIDLQGGGQEDCLITDCIFDGCNKDGVIVVSGNMQGLRLENLSVINQTGARFFYGKANVVDFAITGCEFIGEQTFDWIRFGFAASAPRFVGGAVDIIGNYFGKSQESALFFLGHYSGAEFNIVDNVFLNQKNTSVDIRTTTDTELKLTSMNIIHNKFFRDEYVADIWGCIRLRFTGYTEDLLDVNINYNSISGWGDVDIVDNATSGAFTLQVINFDYNYFADVKEIDNTKNFGGIGKSWENLFESEEELNAMWSKQAEEGPHIW